MAVGAAVTGPGARLIGRVIRAGTTTSDVALLGDPGLTLTAFALVEGNAEPLVLGRLRTIGDGEGGAIRMRWSVSTALVGEAARSARLFSASGEPGLPGGLFLGTTRLPAAASAGEEHQLELHLDVDPADVRSLYVRLEASQDAGSEWGP